MRNDDTLRRQICDALDTIQPSEETKTRIYARLTRRYSAAKMPVKKPWYLRWQTSIIGSAALTCVVVLTVLLHETMPQNGKDSLEVVPIQTTESTAITESTDTTTAVPETTTTAAETHDTETSVATTAVETTATTETATETTAETAAITETVALSTETERPEQTERQTTTPYTTETTAQTTTAAKTTDVSTEKTTTQTIAVTETTAAMTTSTEAFTEENHDDALPLRQSIFSYNLLTWNQTRYRTQFETINGNDISAYLGLSVTEGENVSDTYTVLVYEIKDTDAAQTLAVQYAGLDTYYIFSAAG